ncbi:MAG: hypothetical protein FJ125_11400 [Deltaproteobacteria bacterium]|nr:hypothetical protein [Deltaproteobacteria bacterium]
MIRTIGFERFKSLEQQTLDLGALTILIGPNASGKSNVLDGCRLMSEAVRSDMEAAVTRRGSVESVVFKGSEQRSFAIDLEYFVPDPGAPHSRSDMRYHVEVGSHVHKPAVLREELRIKRQRDEPGAPRTWVTARLGKGTAIRDPEAKKPEAFDTADPGVLALKALGFLTAYPRIRALRTFIESWQLLGVNLDAVRAPRRDERADALLPDASNLANVLRTLQGTEKCDAILADLKDLLHVVDDLRTEVDRGRVLMLLKERPFSEPWEAFSVSDGTLRLLCLLTALHLLPEHGLLCVEEPEHGLHPLIFGPLLDLIRERCPRGEAKQVLLTTHSPDLVDAAEAEEVVTVERDERGATTLTRLEGKKLRSWLDDYRLGELWRMRQIGGVPR